MVTVTVDGKPVTVPRNINVLQACEAAGVDVPRFCYHSRLSIAGNCRMCLVEVVKGPPKPVASCAMPVAPGMEIKTTTPMVKKAREGVMEFLLINHPLDCPICDQGGECDLQDQAFVFGSDRSRFTEAKRAVEDKDLGPFVKTVMTRCIHCTRCVRFAKEIAGVEDLGITGRGNASEVGTYVDKLMGSELSGNVIDLCPVGALTSKPYAFSARPWELKATESVDVLDGLGSAVRVDSRGTAVMRVLPRLNEAVNEEWLSDKARFSYDGLRRQRLATPLVRGAGGGAEAAAGRLAPATWEAALSAAAAGLAAAAASPGGVLCLAGRLSCAESLVALKDLSAGLGGRAALKPEGLPFGSVDPDARASYLFNATVAGVDAADLVLAIGCNPRTEAPVLNARLRRAAVAGAVPVAVLGPDADLTYPTEWLGDDPAALQALASGAHPFFARLKAARRPLVLVGASLLSRPDGAALLAAVRRLCAAAGVVKAGDAAANVPPWNGFSVLHDAGGRVAALDLGLMSPPPPPGAPPFAGGLLLGADDAEEAAALLPRPAFVVYVGSHGDAGAARADVVLPGAAYTEKPGTYVNTEGRPQRGYPAVPPPGAGRDDWKVLRALAEAAGVALPYDSLDGVRARLAEVAPHLGATGDAQPATWLPWLGGGAAAASAPAPSSAPAASAPPLRSAVGNYYQTDVVSRASVTMARATEARRGAAAAAA